MLNFDKALLVDYQTKEQPISHANFSSLLSEDFVDRIILVSFDASPAYPMNSIKSELLVHQYLIN